MGTPTPPAGKIVLTYEDYLDLPDDGNRYEILEGVLHVTPSPTTRHQRVSRNLQRIIDAYVLEHNLGEVFDAPLDVIFSNISIAQPDLIFVSHARSEIITEKNIAGAPDLVVEILSPNTSRRDRITKAHVYALYGVEYYWLVDPDATTVEEYRLEEGAYNLISRVTGNESFKPEIFPGLIVDLSKVWA
ncbi:Uma2 family endonuclease [Desulfofundulus thermocisternus]|jgi:Uma2 family endonuclease|uniref:Uma2 family endonuclease n=1 Tax=Desulfofundulus thermocisternus TaxID=42471 RepID=UPI00047F302E|nr:Uma2 family endonuclease [Desulfofundulus thermocisternus]